MEIEDEQEQFMNENHQQKGRRNGMNILVIVLGFSILTIVSFIILIINLTASYDIKQLSQQYHPGDIEADEIPLQFGVYTAGHVQDQYNRGTCWDFATMRFLESIYRQQGEKQGHLNESSFVQFSDQAHGINLINFCTANKEKCPDTPTSKGTATDGYPSWIYHFQDYLNDKLVVDLCDYTLNDDANQTECDGMKEFQDAQIIKYNVSNYRSWYQIDEIKKQLLKRNTTLPLVTELFFERFYSPCDHSDYSHNCSICGSQNLQNSQYNRLCVYQDLITTAEGQFIARNLQPSQTIGAHAMLLVGWNDEFKSVYNSPGAFIVQNSWGPELSHSLDYLLGRISRRVEEQRCPNFRSPMSWVPVDNVGEDKYKLRKVTVLKYQWANPGGHFHLGDNTESNVWNELLQGLLNASKFYAIHHVIQKFDQQVAVVMAEADTAEALEHAETFQTAEHWITLPAAPFDLLAYAFRPVGDEAAAANRRDVCGYYTIPYDFVDAVQEAKGLWFVDAMDVVFEESSYVNANDSREAAKKVLNATRLQDFSAPKSHTPWLDNPEWVPRFK